MYLEKISRMGMTKEMIARVVSQRGVDVYSTTSTPEKLFFVTLVLRWDFLNVIRQVQIWHWKTNTLL